MTPWHLRDGLSQIVYLEKKLPTVKGRFAVPFVYRGKGLFKSIEPRQNMAEIESLYESVCDINPERILEIGTAKGGTLYLWCQAAGPDATIVSVDLPGGEYGGAYHPARIPFYRSFARKDQGLHLLRADSHRSDTAEKVRKLFDNKPVDFIFIDGDHTYEGVKADFHQYGPLVRPGGLIGFHDILFRADIPDIKAHRFWQEIKDKYDTVEFIGTELTGGEIIGTGLLRVGESPLSLF